MVQLGLRDTCSDTQGTVSHCTQTGLAVIICYESAFSERSSQLGLSIGGGGWPLTPQGKTIWGSALANRAMGELDWK